MKHQSYEYRRRPLAVAGVILLASIGLASMPTRSWSAPGSDQSDTAQATAGVNRLITHLHQELKITPAQESLFQKVADVMRENAETMGSMAKQRADAAKTATAVDDLKSYAAISDAHADGTKKMITAFQPLYDSMSEDQKKTADQEFRDHYATHHRDRH